jgi:putative ABC transport system substrate-binding protein
LSLLQQAVPGLSRLAVLYNAANATKLAELAALRTAAQQAGVTLNEYPVRTAADIPGQFSVIDGNALLVLPESVTVMNRQMIVGLVQQRARPLPALYGLREFTDVGGLMSYGVNRSDAVRRAGTFVAKVLNGADPASLPFEVPRYELIVNQQAASAMNFQFPSTLINLADQVIQLPTLG